MTRLTRHAGLAAHQVSGARRDRDLLARRRHHDSEIVSAPSAPLTECTVVAARKAKRREKLTFAPLAANDGLCSVTSSPCV